MNTQINPDYIMQTATGFWASKVLLTAVELGVFSSIGNQAKTATQLGDEIGLHPRGIYDFFRDELPKADVITMGNILHDWNLEKKKSLSGKPMTLSRRAGHLSRSKT